MYEEYFYTNGSSLIPFIPYETGFHHIYYINYGILVTMLVVVGTVANVLAIAVLLSPRIWSTLNYYLIALALWDSALLISSFTQWSLWTLYFGKAIPLMGRHVSVLRLSYFLGNATLTGCVWVILALTVERYLAIVWPLCHRGMNNAKRAKLVLIMVSVCALIANLSRLSEMDVVSDRYYQRSENSSTYQAVSTLMGTNLRDNWHYFVLYRIVFSLVFIYAGPCWVLAILTLQMVSTITEARQNRKCLTMENLVERAKLANSREFKSESAKEDRITNIVLLTVFVKFLCCYLLPTVIDLLEVCLSGKYYNSSSVIELLIICSNTLVVFNSSTNSLLYFLLSRRFRRELRRLLRGIRDTNVSTNGGFSAKTSCATIRSYGAMGSRTSSLKRTRSNLNPTHRNVQFRRLQRNAFRQTYWSERSSNRVSNQGDFVQMAIRSVALDYVLWVHIEPSSEVSAPV